MAVRESPVCLCLWFRPQVLTAAIPSLHLNLAITNTAGGIPSAGGARGRNVAAVFERTIRRPQTEGVRHLRLSGGRPPTPRLSGGD